MPLLRRLLLLAGIAAAAAVPATAEAGTYTVHACATPDGADAPTTSWKVSAWAPSVDPWADTCPRGGFWISLKPGYAHAVDDSIKVMFSAPEGTQITGYRMWRSARVAPGTLYFHAVVERRGSRETWPISCRGDRGCSAVGNAATPYAEGNLVTGRPSPPLDGLGLYVSCGLTSGTEPCPASTPVAAETTLHRAEIDLQDAHAPVISGRPTGPLVDSGTSLTGVQVLTVLAQDTGGGLVDAQLEVDGRVVATVPFGVGCAPPYATPVPCPRSGAATLPVDTATLADGQHTARVLVRDAGGAVTASEQLGFSTAAHAADCSPEPRADSPQRLQVQVASSARGKSRSRVTVASGRGVTARVRLTGPDGRPVAGTPLCIATRTRGLDGLPSRVANVTTDADGRGTVAIPPGSSREVWAVLRTGGTAVAGRAYVDVRSQATLRATPRRVRNGRLVRLRGTVRSTPRPARGVLVQVQVRSGKRWRTFRTVRTTRDGSYAARYRFRGTRGSTRYRLRARVPAQEGFPFATGASMTTTVRVRG